MKNMILLSLICALLIVSGTAFSQSGKFNFAIQTGYYGDQNDSQNQLTSLKDPLSIGFQLRYHINQDVALQLANESLQGNAYQNAKEELNLQTSLSALFYPVQVWKFSPYISYGLSMSQLLDHNRANTKNNLNYLTGVGTDFLVTNRLFYSFGARFFSDGLDYLGWGTSLSMGFRF